MCILTNANFNISAALSKSAGLFKIPIGGGKHPQGEETSLKIPLDFRSQKKPTFLKIPRLADNLTSQELVEFLFTKRRHVLTLQIHVFQKSYSIIANSMRLVFCSCDLRVGLS